MRKSILRFGALALMSLMSIGSWAQSQGATFQTTNGCQYTVKEVCTDADGDQYFTVILKKATAGAEWADTTEFIIPGLRTNTGWKGDYSPEIGVTEPIPYVVTEVGASAFSGVTTPIQIPNYVKVFGSSALKDKTVTYVDFTNVTEIGVEAFNGATFLSALGEYNFTFNCNPSNSAFWNANFPGGASIILGDATTVINTCAFGANVAKYDLEKVVIKNATGLTEIMDKAFQNRAGITTFGYFNDNGMHYLPASLTTVGNYAFDGCNGITTFRFAANDKNGVNPPRITSVGAYAFKDCTWMNNVTFANVCTSFDAPFTYKEGSFQNCGFTGVIDLSKSAFNVSGNSHGQYNKLGVPKNAFLGNDLGTPGDPTDVDIILNPAFEVIQAGAFKDNANLEIPKVLPSSLWTIETDAFNTGYAKSQDSLYLPETLRFVDQDAFAYRHIRTVLAHPYITGDNRKNDIPVLNATQTALIIDNTYVPASEKFRYGNEAEQSLKYWYGTGKGHWQNVIFATEALMSNDLIGLGFDYLYNVNGVTYRAWPGFDTNDNDYGYIRVWADCFTEGAPEIHGYIGLTDDQFLTDNNPDTDPAVHHDHKLIRQYQYPIVLKVEGFNMGRATYPTATNLAEDVYAISFKPEAAYDDNAGATHADEIASDSRAAYTSIPDNICKENIALVTTDESNPVTIGSGITTIGQYAFAGTTNLTAIDLPASLTTVFDGAFADATRTAGLDEVTLPKSLSNIGSHAFDAASIKKVNVSYTSIPNTLPADAFASDANNELFIPSLVASNRTAYVSVSNWKKFFDYRVTVETSTNPTLMVNLDQPNLKQSYTEDEDLDGDGYYTKQYVLKDDASLTQVKITDLTPGAKVPVKYVRNFNSANKVQCWYVPFDFKYEAGNGYKFYYIYNTTQSSEEADAETRIGLRAVQNDTDPVTGEDLGYATIKANTPYIIMVSQTGEKSFYGEALTETPAINVVENPVVVKDVKNEYTFAGVYQRKGGNPTNPWYGISNGAFRKYTESQLGINAFRFYMKALHQPNPYNLVKFVFDDEEEETTGIKDANIDVIANGAMFDLMGRQITAPAKGQVYIQNGVKKLAK